MGVRLGWARWFSAQTEGEQWRARQLRLVLAWAELHESDLLENRMRGPVFIQARTPGGFAAVQVGLSERERFPDSQPRTPSATISAQRTPSRPASAVRITAMISSTVGGSDGAHIRAFAYARRVAWTLDGTYNPRRRKLQRVRQARS